MKIGIITWFRYENFGTALQAVALQAFLRSNGHNVELIDYKIPIAKNNRPSKTKDLYHYEGVLLRKASGITDKKALVKKNKKFKEFISRNCNVTKYIETEKEYIEICNSYDVLIFGSDQIWNPNWYHPFYFANYEEVKTPRISYAPSFGVSSIKGEDIENIKIALNRFEKLAVREKTGVEIVEKLINKTPELVVDPTFLLSEIDWKKQEPKDVQKEKYILAYMLTDNKNHWKAIKKFVKEKKMKLVILPHDGHSLIQSKNVIKNAGPEDFLSLVDNAENVITDSYHALIFSLIFKKPCVLFERHNPNLPGAENSRIYSLLELLKNKECLHNFNTDKINEAKIIVGVGDKLERIVEKSKEYLKNAIKEFSDGKR